MNRYTYCCNNPITYTDPSGHKKKKYKDDYYIDNNYTKNIYCTPGSQGSYVYDLEKKLAAMGIRCGKVDGIYDSNTYVAIQKYQKAHHIKPSGFVEQRTMSYINAGYRYETMKNNIPLNQREAYKNNLASTVSYKEPGRGGKSIDIDKMYQNMLLGEAKFLLEFTPVGTYNDAKSLYNDIKNDDGSNKASFYILLDLIGFLPAGDGAKGANKVIDLADDASDAGKTIKKVGNAAEGVSNDFDGVRIINKKYAGQTFELSGDLAKKYPNGVMFTNDGFPNFQPYAKIKVKIQGLRGNTTTDFTVANKAAGLKSKPSGYTWHHGEDGVTMLLVPTDLHDAVRHTGGAALLSKGLVP